MLTVSYRPRARTVWIPLRMHEYRNMSARRGIQFVTMGMPIICLKTSPTKTTKMLSTTNSSIETLRINRSKLRTLLHVPSKTQESGLYNVCKSDLLLYLQRKLIINVISYNNLILRSKEIKFIKKYCNIYRQKLTFRISRIYHYVNITVQSKEALHIAATTGKSKLCRRGSDVFDYPSF